MKWQHSLVIMLGGAGLLVLAGALVAALAIHPPEATYRPGTPEATVATYFRLLQQGKLARASDLTYSIPNFEQQFASWSSTPHRVTLVATDVSGDTASVTVDITAASSSPLGPVDFTCRQTLTLLRNGSGTWLISGPEWLSCGW
jgi:hypothetical protein